MCKICKGKLFVIVDGKIKPCSCIYVESDENWGRVVDDIVLDYHRKRHFPK